MGPISTDSLLSDLHAILVQLEKVRQQRVNVEYAVKNITSAIAEVKGPEAQEQQDGKREEPVKAEEACIDEAEAEIKEGARDVELLLFELVLFSVFFPVLVILANISLGCFLALMEKWSWHVGVEYAISITCGLANPLGEANNVNPSTGLGMTIAGVVGLWTVGLTGVLAGYAANTRFVNKISSGIQYLAGGGEDRPFRNYVGMNFTVFIFSPIVVVLFVLVFGCILAGAENWAWSDGAYYNLANVGGLPNPLVNNTPNSQAGRWLDVIISTWMFMFSNIIIGLGSNLEMPQPEDSLSKLKLCWARSRSARVSPRNVTSFSAVLPA